MDLGPKVKSNKCKGCKERHTGCHATCKSYSNYRKELDAVNEKIRKAKYAERLGYGPGYNKIVEEIKSGKYAKK